MGGLQWMAWPYCCCYYCDAATDCVVDPPPDFAYVTLTHSFSPLACPGNPSLGGNYTLTKGAMPTWSYPTAGNPPVGIGACPCDSDPFIRPGVTYGTYMSMFFSLGCVGNKCRGTFLVAVYHYVEAQTTPPWQPAFYQLADSWTYQAFTPKGASSWTLPYVSSKNYSNCLFSPNVQLYDTTTYMGSVKITSTPP